MGDTQSQQESSTTSETLSHDFTGLDIPDLKYEPRIQVSQFKCIACGCKTVEMNGVDQYYVCDHCFEPLQYQPPHFRARTTTQQNALNYILKEMNDRQETKYEEKDITNFKQLSCCYYCCQHRYVNKSMQTCKQCFEEFLLDWYSKVNHENASQCCEE